MPITVRVGGVRGLGGVSENASLQLHTVSKSGSNAMSTALHCLDKLFRACVGNYYSTVSAVK